MKKKKWLNLFLVLTLLIVPMFMLSACKDTQYYNVFVKASSSKGSVGGPDGKSKIAEGTEITLSANNDLFICWVRNESKVVSIDKVYKFNLNASNAGVYTGVFAESYATMNYFALTDVEVQLKGYTQFLIKINITPATATTEKNVIYEGSLSEGNLRVYDGRVYSFLNETRYIVDAEILYNFDQEGQAQKVINVEQLILEKNSFDADGSYKINSLLDNEDDENALLTLNFKKLDLSLAQSTFEK